MTDKNKFLEDLKTLISINSVKCSEDADADAGAPFGKGVRKALDYLRRIYRRSFLRRGAGNRNYRASRRRSDRRRLDGFAFRSHRKGRCVLRQGYNGR